jgi:hypothetical protein
MNKTVTSKVLGKLEQDAKFSDWWISTEISIPFFDGDPFSVVFMDFEPENDKDFIKDADEAIGNFIKLTEKDRLNISKLIHENCVDFMASVGFNDVDARLREIKDDSEIWKFVRPIGISASRRPRNDKDIYIQVTCDCAWEEEHGLQLVFRQGRKLTRVSDIDGHLTEADAFGKPDEEDYLLSKFT